VRGTLANPTPHVGLWAGGVFAGVAVAQMLSAALWNHQGGTHIVWFPGAVLLSALFSTPARLWPALVLAAYLGVLTTGVAFGLPLFDTALVIAPPILLTPVAAWLLLRVPGDAPLLENFTKLFAFAAIAVGVLPAISAALIEIAARYTSFQGTVLSDWANIALAHALGYVLYVPVWISLRSPGAAVRSAGRIPLSFLLGMGCSIFLLGLLWVVFDDTPALIPLLCLAPAPILVAACFRGQMAGSSVAMFLIVIMAAHLSVRGYGPFVAETPQRTTLAVQLWTLTASLCALTVAALVEQRRAAQRLLDNAQDDIRALAGRLIATQEQERARLARDLHDDINQRLAATSIGLSALRRRVPQSEAHAVSQIQSQVVTLSEDLRQLSHQLHPSWLAHVGLHHSLEALCASPRFPMSPRVVLSVDPAATALPNEVTLCFYRVVQEALNNALHHAAASVVTIDVSISQDNAALRIIDDGRGFDTAVVKAHGPGIGLTSMSERAKLLGGSFELQSTPGKGVDLCIQVPLKAA
jgi:signal transduction histidine kinase